MNNLLTALLVVFTLISCEKADSKSSDLYTFVPEGSSYIISTKNLPVFLAQIDSSNLFDKDKVQSGFNISAIKEFTKLLEKSRSLITFSKKDSLTYHYLLITEAKKDTLLLQNHANFSIESISTKELDYKKITIDNNVTYSTFIDNTILASSSKKLLIDAVTHSTSKKNIRSESFIKAISAASLDKTALFVNHTALKSSVGKKNKFDKPIADWSVIDLDLGSLKMNFNGISVSNIDSQNLLNIFEKIQHQKYEIQNIVPIAATGFYSFTYNDFKNVDANLKKFKNDSLILNDNNLLNFTKEASVIFLKADMAIALNTTDAQLAKESLPSSEEQITEYRGISIFSTLENSYLKFLEPLISSEGVTVYCFLDNFLVYAKNQEVLELIISNYQNNTTYSKQESFIDLQSDLAESSSLLFVSTPKFKTEIENGAISFQIQGIFTEHLINDYSFLAIQFVKSEGFSHIHGTVGKRGSVNDEDVQKTVTVTLPEPISGVPFLFSISNKTNAIVYQDINNVLYAISIQEKTLWKKHLDSKILGDIQQIDLKKNGSQHLAFATLNNFFVIDGRGKEIAGFPLKFEDLITQQLSIFDYDNNRNYRFVITQKNKLLMYDAKGKAVNGFNFNGASSEIIQPPKHIRIKNKDYIVFPEKSGKLQILSRQGKERILVKEKFQFSENEWYENKNEFISISENGKLIQIDQNGQVSKKDLKSEAKLQLVANENTLVLLSENNLTINTKELILDFGLYTSPKIFSISGKTFISITDTQAKKVYLFNEKGELSKNFPVYGISLINITDSKTRNKSTLLVLGGSNEIIIYEF